MDGNDLDIGEMLKSHIFTFSNSLTKDRSTQLLLFANLVCLIVFYFGVADSGAIAVSFFIQFISIGLMTSYKLLSQKNLLQKNIRVNLDFLNPKKNGYNILFVLFFFVHFGLFSIILYLSLTSLSGSSSDVLMASFLGLLFFYAHLYSLKKNWPKEGMAWSTRNLMPHTYIRTIPMLFAFVFPIALFLSSLGPFVVLLSIISKSIFDVLLHYLEHKSFLQIH
jgi:hypothetical protein